MSLENSYAGQLTFIAGIPYVVGPGLGHTRAYSLTFNHENVIIKFVEGIDYCILVTYLRGNRTG